MNKRLLPALIASLFVAAPAFAQYGEWYVEGSATVGPFYNSTNDTTDASKLEEYRDLGNGVLSNIFVRGRGGRAWFEGYGENFGRDDQYLMLRGGVYDQFKYKIYTDSLRHNFLFNGLTPFAGTGSELYCELELDRHRLQAHGQRRLLRVAGRRPVVLPRRRQPGQVRRHEDRIGFERK